MVEIVLSVGAVAVGVASSFLILRHILKNIKIHLDGPED